MGVRPPRGAPPPFPHPPQLSSSSPGRGGGTWSGAGRGSRPEWVRGAPQLRAHAALGNFVAAPQVWGLAEVCMWGARASRRAAAALSSPCWSSPEEASKEKGVCPLPDSGEKCRSGNKIPGEHCNFWKNIVRN